VEVEKLLLLKSSTNLNGNIKANKLSIEAGALFSGNCMMNNAGSKASNEIKQTEKGA